MATLSTRFRQARTEDYAALLAQLTGLEERLSAELKVDERSHMRDKLKRLRQQHAYIAHVDFFNAQEGDLVASRLGRMAQTLAAGEPSAASIIPAAIKAYRETRWVTRPRPHVDRLACIWFIRRFMNPSAVIRYAQIPEPEEVTFDMREGAFSHRGNLCTFETMVGAFGLKDQSLRLMGEIMHEVDVRDGRYRRDGDRRIDMRWITRERAKVDRVACLWLISRFIDPGPKFIYVPLSRCWPRPTDK